jgi:hypothetical protein
LLTEEKFLLTGSLSMGSQTITQASFGSVTVAPASSGMYYATNVNYSSNAATATYSNAAEVLKNSTR